MKIKIIIVGKTKEKFIQQGEEEFKKRLMRYCRLQLTIVREEKIAGNQTGQIIKLKEAEKILNKLSKDSFTIALDETGDQMSSEQFAEFFQHKMNEGVRELTFIIGGALGLDSRILKGAKKTMSLSRMTFTHEMSRLILLEQLYRAFTILKGEKYHKGLGN